MLGMLLFWREEAMMLVYVSGLYDCGRRERKRKVSVSPILPLSVRLQSNIMFPYFSPLLILGYASGFQIWDVSNLASVTEVLNINLDTSSGDADEWGRVEKVVTVVVIPAEASKGPRRSLGETVRMGDDGKDALLGVL